MKWLEKIPLRMVLTSELLLWGVFIASLSGLLQVDMRDAMTFGLVFLLLLLQMLFGGTGTSVLFFGSGDEETRPPVPPKLGKWAMKLELLLQMAVALFVIPRMDFSESRMWVYMLPFLVLSFIRLAFIFAALCCLRKRNGGE